MCDNRRWTRGWGGGQGELSFAQIGGHYFSRGQQCRVKSHPPEGETPPNAEVEAGRRATKVNNNAELIVLVLKARGDSMPSGILARQACGIL